MTNYPYPEDAALVADVDIDAIELPSLDDLEPEPHPVGPDGKPLREMDAPIGIITLDAQDERLYQAFLRALARIPYPRDVYANAFLGRDGVLRRARQAMAFALKIRSEAMRRRSIADVAIRIVEPPPPRTQREHDWVEYWTLQATIAREMREDSTRRPFEPPEDYMPSQRDYWPYGGGATFWEDWDRRPRSE